MSLLSKAQEWQKEKGVEEIRLGTPYERVEVPEMSYFEFGDEMVALKKEDRTVHLQTYDLKSLEQKAHHVTELEEKKMVHEGTVKLGGELYFLYAWWDGDKEVERLFYRKVDRKDCKLDPPKKLIRYSDHRMKGIRINAGFFSWKTVDKFDFFTSLKDPETGERKMLARFLIEPGDHDGAEGTYMAGLYVFNEDMELEWKGIHELPYQEERMDRLGFTVSRNGNVYLLAKVYEGEDPDDEGPFHFEVLKFSEEGGSFDFAKAEMEDELTAHSDQVAFHNTEGKGLSVSGFFAAQEHNDVAQGIFHWSVDRSDGSGKLKMNRFSKDLICAYESGGVRRRVERRMGRDGLDHPKVGIWNLDLRNTWSYENGDVLLVGEVYNTTVHRINDETYTEYNYDHMVASRLSPGRKVKWVRKLPKYQKGRAKGMDLSFMSLTSSEEAKFIFFDNKDNMDLTKDEEPESHQSRAKGWLTAYRVGHGKGKLTKTRILNIVDLKGQEFKRYSIDRFIKTGPDSFVFEVTNSDDKDLLVKVKF